MLKIIINDKQLVLNAKIRKTLFALLRSKNFSREFSQLKASKPFSLNTRRSISKNDLNFNIKNFIHSSILFNQQNDPFKEFQQNSSQNSPKSDDKSSNSNKNEENKDDKSNNEKLIQLIKFLGASSLMFGLMIVLSSPFTKSSENSLREGGATISWNEFVNLMLAKGEVQELTAFKEREIIFIKLYPAANINGEKSRYAYYKLNMPLKEFEEKLNKAENDLKIPSENRIPIKYIGEDNGLEVLLLLLFISGLIYMAVAKNKKGIMQTMNPLSQFTKARFTMVDSRFQANIPTVTFKDVAGLKEAKVEIMEFVQYLRDPSKFVKLGAKVPKGALLLGPPGCGKTLLAKALAAEAGVPFFSMAGTEFIEVIGGVGAARVRDLFAEARKSSPSIVFIDEIDAVGQKRSSAGDGDSNSEMDQTLNQLLSEMDGLETKGNVIVLASTNRPDTLDKALTRPGRLDRKIEIDLPTFEERIEIINVYLKKLAISKEIDTKFVSELSHLTARMSGADLANVCNEAALHAARELKTEIQKIDFETALEKIQSGSEKKSSSIVKEEQKLIAYYECGRVLMSWLLEYGDLLYKVSVIPRTKTLALSHYLPSDKTLITKEEIFDRMCFQLGGKVAQALVFNTVTTRSRDDLRPVTRLAYAQVQSFGMSDKIGQMSFPTREEQAEYGMRGSRPFSKHLQRLIDEEASELIANAHKRTEELLKKNISKLHVLTEALMKKETLVFKEIVELIGKPVSDKKVESAGLNNKDNK